MESLRGYESNSDEEPSTGHNNRPAQGNRAGAAGASAVSMQDREQSDSVLEEIKAPPSASGPISDSKGPDLSCNTPHGNRDQGNASSHRKPSPGHHRRSKSPPSGRSKQAHSSASNRRLSSPQHDERSHSPVRHKRPRSPAGQRRTPSPHRHKRSHEGSPGHQEHSPVRQRGPRSPVHRRRSRSPARHKGSRSPNYRRRSRSPAHHKSRPSGYRRSSASSYQERSRSPPRPRSQRSRSPRRHRSRSPVRRSVTSPSCREEATETQLPAATPSAHPQSSNSKPEPSVGVGDGKSGDDSGQVVLAGRKLTPEEKLEQALAAAQALAPKLPTCMNPGAMNPVRYHSLQEKKKLLWSKKKEGQSRNKWEMASIDGEEAQTSKFRRLMGISADKVDDKTLREESDQLKEKHAKTLSNLEEQYETSRFVTHVAKGAGLGYGSGSLLTEIPGKPHTE